MLWPYGLDLIIAGECNRVVYRVGSLKYTSDRSWIPETLWCVECQDLISNLQSENQARGSETARKAGTVRTRALEGIDSQNNRLTDSKSHRDVDSRGKQTKDLRKGTQVTN